jgi:septum site-determining protein MinD
MSSIGIVSGKGGVGKTTLVANLACCLTKLGYNITVVDTNLTTPHLGLQLGVSLAPKTLHDVLRGDEDIFKVMYPHPLGFKFVSGSLSVDALSGADLDRLSDAIANLSGVSDFLLLDSAPGLGKEALSALQASENILIITNPDLPSVVDALKAKNIAERLNKSILGVVVNRVKKRPSELKKHEIESMLGQPVIAEIPEDENVPKSIAFRLPVVELSPNSPAAVEITKVAYFLTGRSFPSFSSFGFLGRLIDWLRR